MTNDAAHETKVFINLPVRDLKKSIAFYEALGYHCNQQFSDDTGACLVISEHIYVMLLTHPKFEHFSSRPISDATKSTEVLIALSCENRERVDELVQRAIRAGGQAPRPEIDHGFMYQHGFEDLDGHVWEVFYMDPSHVQPQ